MQFTFPVPPSDAPVRVQVLYAVGYLVFAVASLVAAWKGVVFLLPSP